MVAVALVAEPRDLPALGRILASHALVHSAEGELYREVMAEAAEAEGVPLFHFPSSELTGQAALAAVRALEQVSAPR